MKCQINTPLSHAFNRQPDPEDQDNAGVRMPPPVIHALSMLVGVGLMLPVPLNLPAQIPARVPGQVLLTLAALLFVLTVREFVRARTAIPPNLPATALIWRGPYQFSRNPLYLALALLQAGISLVSGNAWILLLIIPTLIIVRRYVIAREEQYLERRFGARYLEYKSSVRRWF